MLNVALKWVLLNMMGYLCAKVNGAQRLSYQTAVLANNASSGIPAVLERVEESLYWSIIQWIITKICTMF